MRIHSSTASTPSSTSASLVQATVVAGAAAEVLCQLQGSTIAVRAPVPASREDCVIASARFALGSVHNQS